MNEPTQISPDSEPVPAGGTPCYPEPKVYAPFLLKLENEHPGLAPHLTGIGDGPCEYDVRKRKVRVVFQTEAGTEVKGRYITEAATADSDARTFLAVMATKFRAVTATDKKVLAEEPSPVVAPVTETAFVDGTDGPEPVEAEVQAEPEPEPATPPDEGDEDWGKDTSA